MVDLKRQLSAILRDKYLATALGCSAEDLANLADRDEWYDRVRTLLERSPISAEAVVALAGDYVTALGLSLPENWPLTVYNLGSKNLFHNRPAVVYSDRIRAAAFFSLDLLAFCLDAHRQVNGLDKRLDFLPLPEEERDASPYAEEFARLLNVWEVDYIDEILRLGREVTPYDLLAHIVGVQRVALTVGLQLKAGGVPVDPVRLSGAAMVHDIGKFGPKNAEETKRMAYLHYYYTEQWCNRHGLPGIGHIAANHSTWDLELENLAVESMLLIYGDFRSKAKEGKRGPHEEIVIYSLSDAYQVILNKLDNVDEAKKHRYERVYQRLADFEAFMTGYGVDVTLGDRQPPSRRPAWIGMLDAQATPRIFKDLAFRHNIDIMHRLGQPAYLRNMLEALRAADDAVTVRAYLTVFEEYMTYMTRPQKELIFNYLLEMLIYPEGDIRRQAAHLIGTLLAGFDERYSKWLPENAVREREGRSALSLWHDVLDQVFSPDHKLGDRYRRFQGYAFHQILNSLLANLPDDDRPQFLAQLFHYYRKPDCDDLTAFILLDALAEVPMKLISDRDGQMLLRTAETLAKRDNVEVRLAILQFFEKFIAEGNLAAEVIAPYWDRVRALPMIWAGEGYQQAHIDALLSGGHCQLPDLRSSELFLENLKSSTPWQVKRVNIRRLAEALVDDSQMNRLHVALHFSNLLKVSEQINVRHEAGTMLVNLAAHLSDEEVNEVAVELCRGLEMDSFEFTKYIPTYLARLCNHLQPREYDEILVTLASLVDAKNETTAQLAVDTVAHMVAGFENRDMDESAATRRQRLSRLVGLLMKGLAGFHDPVKLETLGALGRFVFGNAQLPLAYRRDIFDIAYKRLLMLVVSEEEADALDFYARCALLNHLYRFLSDYFLSGESWHLFENKQVAFFPGTFDPFTLGHKAIVQKIRDQGFEVYLGLDEFSWSKNTQPTLIRRAILKMSVAEEENVFLFPPIFPVNIAAAEDLARLKEVFHNKDLFLVVGSDVLANASAYRQPPTSDSVHQINHIVVHRPGDGMDAETRAEALARLEAKVLEMDLPDLPEGVSSTTIRKNIEKNRDISHLIDTMAQNYIYTHNLYLGERKTKAVQTLKPYTVRRVPAEDGRLWHDIEALFEKEKLETQALGFLGHALPPDSILVNIRREGALESFVLAQVVSSRHLFDVVGRRDICRYLREKGSGHIAFLSRLAFSDEALDGGQRALSEALLWALEASATLAVYVGHGREEKDRLTGLLTRHGFQFLPAAFDSEGEDWYAVVHMRAPLLLSNNVSTLLKAPYAQLPAVDRVLAQTHQRLMAAMTAFHPGELVLSYESAALETELAHLVSAENGVPAQEGEERELGPAMCVPFGHLLRRSLVANTVTRPLYVQRLYPGDMRQLSVGPLPYQPDLKTQAQVLSSFHRPVILADEVLNRGRTLEGLLPLLEAEGVPIQSIVCGIITGSGRDIQEDLGLSFRALHYLPNIRYWMVDSKAYPFIDGYARADRPVSIFSGLARVVNPVLPFAASPLFRDADSGAVWRYSQTALENALAIMQVLEESYQAENERNLTLRRMAEVFNRPMIPEYGAGPIYDMTRSPSYYIKQNLSQLAYFENLIPKER
ncbi:HD domain-containing protein [Peptococcus simiae]|uniref:nicotinate-nucleotide adenylyltransferase n=1 Tax=Peptococcus simiae TaxID=1643805 RepID=A0ABW9GVS1_9FIRM